MKTNGILLNNYFKIILETLDARAQLTHFMFGGRCHKIFFGSR